MINMRQSIIDALNRAENIAIAGHIQPDGDAVGACFALALTLKKMGKNPIVVLEEYNEKIDIIPGKEFLFHGDLESLEIDAFVVLDLSDPKRLGAAALLLNKTEETICIDHHLLPKNFTKYSYYDATASSTCQLVYNIVNQLIAIDKEIATAIYAGIVFDTGGFRHSNTSPETFITAARLIDLGIPFETIYNEVMYAHSFKEAQIFARAISTMKIVQDGKIACVFVTLKDFEDFEATSQHLDGIVQFALNTRGVQVSVMFYERSLKETKVSIRSTKADIQAVAMKFGGGGHKQAAACVIKAPMATAHEQVLLEIKAQLDK